MSIEGGKKIKAARKAQRLTQRQLAEKLNLATGTIQQYELGKRQPPTQTIEKIADILSVPPFDLVGEGDPVSIHWIDLDTEKQRADIVERTRERLKSAGPFKKISTEEAHRLGILNLTFNSEEDRIAYFYSRLNTDGKLAASKCFYQHLDKDRIREVADYVERLSEIPQYQRPATPQSPPCQQVGTDTTPPPDVPETAPEGE